MKHGYQIYFKNISFQKLFHVENNSAKLILNFMETFFKTLLEKGESRRVKVGGESALSMIYDMREGVV